MGPASASADVPRDADRGTDHPGEKTRLIDFHQGTAKNSNVSYRAMDGAFREQWKSYVWGKAGARGEEVYMKLVPTAAVRSPLFQLDDSMLIV